MDRAVDEDDESLWWLAASPLVWLLHFVASYATASLYCARRTAIAADLGSVRVAIAVYTVVALGTAGAIGWRGLRRQRADLEAGAHDIDTRAGRYRFLGFATVLLSGLSVVAILFVAMPAAFMETCR